MSVGAESLCDLSLRRLSLCQTCYIRVGRELVQRDNASTATVTTVTAFAKDVFKDLQNRLTDSGQAIEAAPRKFSSQLAS